MNNPYDAKNSTPVANPVAEYPYYSTRLPDIGNTRHATNSAENKKPCRVQSRVNFVEGDVKNH
jgi:hypothetical protein